MKRIVLFVFILLMISVATACREPLPLDFRGDNSAVGLNDTLTLAFADTIRLSNADRLTFSNVYEDSRCPVDVVCFWAGNARLGFQINDTGFALDSNNSLGSKATVLGYEISLIKVLPQAHSDSLLTPDHYQAVIAIRSDFR